MMLQAPGLIPASYVYLIRLREDREQVLLQLRAGTGYLDGYWVAGAAGHIELGESAEVAAAREVEEELGVSVRPQDLSLLTVMQRTDGTSDPRAQRVDWFWKARKWLGEPRICEPEKCAGLSWFDLDALPNPMAAYEHLILHGLAQGTLAATTTFGFPSSRPDLFNQGGL